MDDQNWEVSPSSGKTFRRGGIFEARAAEEIWSLSTLSSLDKQIVAVAAVADAQDIKKSRKSGWHDYLISFTAGAGREEEKK